MPELSVVIPTLARRPTLLGVLERLARQDVDPARFEVVVVLDAASGAPPELPSRVAVVRARRPGASAARNAGWRTARAPLVLFLDDDVLPDPRCVGEHLAGHARHPDERVGLLGSVRWAKGLRVTPFMRWVERGIQFDFGTIEGDRAGWGRFYTANASVKRALVERAGGFDEEELPFGYEDLDLARRMADLGFDLRYAPRASAEHLHPMRVEEWETRVRRIARAERAFVRKHPDVAPYFHDLFAPYEHAPPPRGRALRLAPFVPPRTPWLGPRVWATVDLGFKARLAPHFLRAWREAG